MRAIRRVASCSCGNLQAIAIGEPVRVSVCHCLASQRRTGSAHGFQARFPRERVELSGEPTEFPAPRFSVWESRRHAWVSVPEDAERSA